MTPRQNGRRSLPPTRHPALSPVTDILLLSLGFVLLILPGLLSGCSRGSPGEEESADSAYRKEYQRGPVTLTVTLSRTTMTVADSTILRLSAVADIDYTVTFPPVGSQGEQFALIDHGESSPVADRTGRTTVARWYLLEAYLSGELTIPPLTVRFSRTDGSDSHVIQTEPVTLSVSSLLAGDYEQAQIREIEGVLSPPRSRTPWVVAGAAGALLALATAGLLLWRRHRKQEIEAFRAVPPHILALRRLDELARRQPQGFDEVQSFYHGITAVLRHYIEARFGLNAPELTTEEFLERAQQARVFSPSLRTLLRLFLQHCDLVKFARVNPSPTEIDETVVRCRQFILSTEPEPATPGSPPQESGHAP